MEKREIKEASRNRSGDHREKGNEGIRKEIKKKVERVEKETRGGRGDSLCVSQLTPHYKKGNDFPVPIVGMGKSLTFFTVHVPVWCRWWCPS